MDLEVIQLVVCTAPRLGGATGKDAPGAAAAAAATILSPADLSIKVSRGSSHSGGRKTEMSLQASQMLELYISYQDCKLGVEILIIAYTGFIFEGDVDSSGSSSGSD